MTVAALRIAHYSDTHVGREQYHEAVNTNGWNQRGVDIVRAFHNVATDIIGRADVPLALHAGDVGDSPDPGIRYMLAARSEIHRIARPLHPGSPYIRQHVVIAGNHDQPRSPNDPCYLGLFRGAPGVHIITGRYQLVDFEKEVAAGIADPALANVVVHAIPHDELKSLDWESVRPIEGKINIMLTHGVAEGSQLFIRARGREYPIPGDVLALDWDYVALGHWHKRGPVFLSADSQARESKIWYSGSPENCNFSDAREDKGKGYLLVDIPGDRTIPKVEQVTLPIRSMVTLPAVDATDMSPEDIAAQLLERVETAKKQDILRGSVVRQRVVNANQDLWALVDRKTARDAARSALTYDCRPLFKGGAEVDDGDHDCDGTVPSMEQTTTNYEELLTEHAAATLPERLRGPAITKAKALLVKYLDTPPTDEAEAPDMPAPEHPDPLPADAVEAPADPFVQPAA